MAADEGVRVIKKADEEAGGIITLVLASEHPEAPDAVKSFHFIDALIGSSSEVGERLRLHGEIILSPEADSHVDVTEKADKRLGVEIFEAFLEEIGDRFCGGIFGEAGLGDGVDTTGFVRFPTGDEVGDEEFAIVAPIDVGDGGAPAELG